MATNDMGSKEMLMEMYYEGKFSEIAERFQSLAHKKYHQFKNKFYIKPEQEDVVQECMVEVVKAIKSFNPSNGCGIPLWIEKCVHNRMIELAKHYATNKVVERARQVGVMDTPPDEESGVEGSLDAREVVLSSEETGYEDWEYRQDLYNSIGLTEDERKVLDLIEYGYKNVEIAKQLSRSEGWVSQKVKSAKTKWLNHLNS